MRDCTDQTGEYRDLLPELAAEGEGGEPLAPADRARVAEHVATCEACRAELELLRAARRGAMAATPAINVTRIVAALPHPPRAAAPVARRVRRSGWSGWAGWSVAAAVSTIAVAGLSVVVMRDGARGVSVREPVPATAPAVRVPDQPVAAPPSAPAAVPVPVPAPQPRHSPPVPAPAGSAQRPSGESEVAAGGLEVSGGLSGLDETQLQALLRDMDSLEAEPVGEPEAAAPALRAAAEGA